MQFLLFVLFLTLVAFGVPIAISLAVSGISFIYIYHLGIDILSPNFYSGIAKFPLLAIPFFVLAGVIMDRAGMAEKMVLFMKKLAGFVTGGLAIVTVLVGMFWAAISGSGPADTAALSTILIPGMKKAGYRADFAAALVAASGSLGIVIPPSIALIIYGTITNTSVPALFAGGIIPGIIVGFSLMMAAYLISKKEGYRKEEFPTLKEVLVSFKEAFWALLAPVIILGGIYGGIFTPTEAASVAVFYGLFVGIFIYRTIDFKTLYHLMVDAAVNASVIMIIVTFAGIFSWTGSTLGLMDKITNFILSVGKEPILAIFMINILLLLAGMFLDAISIYFIFLPILLPVLDKFHWSYLWFGVIMTINLAIGQITPPVGVNLFVAANIAKVKFEDISKAAIPFIVAAFSALILLMYTPFLTTYLPKVWGLIK